VKHEIVAASHGKGSAIKQIKRVHMCSSNDFLFNVDVNWVTLHRVALIQAINFIHLPTPEVESACAEEKTSILVTS
jgi:hypothetical protein